MSSQNEQSATELNTGSIQLVSNTQEVLLNPGSANIKSVTQADSGAYRTANVSQQVLVDLMSASIALCACLVVLVVANYKLRKWFLN